MKRCSRCQQTKPLTDFNHDKTREDGHSIYCRICHRAIHRMHYRRNQALRQQVNTAHQNGIRQLINEFKKETK